MHCFLLNFPCKHQSNRIDLPNFFAGILLVLSVLAVPSQLMCVCSDFRTSQALEQINLGELANSSIFLKQMERFLLLTKPSRITVDFLREVRKRLHKEPGSG